MRLLFVGDFCAVGRLDKLGIASEVLGEFRESIRRSDLAITNLEAPICKPLAPINKSGPSIALRQSAAEFLADAGFGLAALANNHIYDYGDQGLRETIRILRGHKIDYVGAGFSYREACRPYKVTVEGQNISILNFAENEWSTTRGSRSGASPIDPIRNFQVIKEARDDSDFVVVICHSGHEMYELPSPRMKELFRFYVEAGASAVVNHHTHCVSGFEVYQGAPIFYSLGNFLFDNAQLRSGPWTQGIAVELRFSSNEVTYRIYNFDQCTEEKLFNPCDQQTSERRFRKIDALNEVINDDERLDQSFLEYSKKQAKRYRRYLEPTRSRLLLAAQNNGFAPSLLSKRQRTLLLNLFRCEAHRDLIIEMLERDVGNSQ